MNRLKSVLLYLILYLSKYGPLTKSGNTKYTSKVRGQGGFRFRLCVVYMKGFSFALFCYENTTKGQHCCDFVRYVIVFANSLCLSSSFAN